HHVDAHMAASLEGPFEDFGIPPVYTPRAIVAIQQGAAKERQDHPFDNSSPILQLEKLMMSVAVPSPSQTERPKTTTPLTIDQQAAMLMREVNGLARWWVKNGDRSVSV